MRRSETAVMSRGRAVFLASLLSASPFISGCSSIYDSASVKRPYVQAYVLGDLQTASAIADDKAKSREGTGDYLMWLLEAGKCAFARGDYQASLSYFEAAERTVDEYDARAAVSARDVAAEAASAATNPNAIPYRGSYVDREMINAYKALIYFAWGKPEDACVEIKRMHERQKKALDGKESELKAADDLAAQNKLNPTTLVASSPELKNAASEMTSHAYKTYANKMNPFCSYLSSIGYLWRGDFNEAMVDYRNLHDMDPSNPLFNSDYATIGRLTNEKLPEELAKLAPSSHALNNGVVFLIVESGLIPSRRGVTVHMMLPPPVGYTGFAFPVLDFYPAPVSRVDWSDNAGSSGHTFLVSDMDAVASHEFQEAMRTMVIREVIGILVKEGATVTAYELTRNNNNHYSPEANFAAYLILLGAGLWKYTFNTADTRSWQTLPKWFLATHFPMPKDGIVRLAADGGPIKSVFQLDTRKKMTIVYVQTPGNGVFSVKVFQFD